MTKQQFFDTFGINPIYTYTVTDQFYTDDSHSYSATKDDIIEYFEGKNCGRYKVTKVHKFYPRISGEMILRLFILGQDYFDFSFKGVCFENIQQLQDNILRQLIRYENRKFNHSIKEKIQELFEGPQWNHF